MTMKKPAGKLAFAYATITKMEARIAELEAIIANHIEEQLEMVERADPAVERQEPVAWQRMSKMQGGRWFEMNAEDVEQAKGAGYTVRPLFAEQPAPVTVASRDESISWLKRIDGIGQNRAELIYSMGFRLHPESTESR